jgi:ketopantoate reductase
MSAPMAHAVPGAGGVGVTIGACLAHLGDSVTLVVRRDELAQSPRAHCISKARSATSM